VRGWLHHGQQLTASAVYGRELYASKDVAFYGAICVVFPVIGAIMGVLGGVPSGVGERRTARSVITERS